jgi:hypothetical protein
MLKNLAFSVSISSVFLLTSCGGGGEARTSSGSTNLIPAAIASSTINSMSASSNTTVLQVESQTKISAKATPTPVPTKTPSPTKTPVSTKTATPVSTPVRTSAPITVTAGLWSPQVKDTWQWQLTGTLNTTYNVNVYDVDMFDTTQAMINSMKAQGRHIVCYFSAGSAENWRSDYAKFQPSDLGNNLDGWPGERWVNTQSANVRAIMQARLDLAASKSCDAVEPDNVDEYTNKPGFPLTAATQIDYNTFIATEAHKRGLRVGLKNDVDQVSRLAPIFDFAVNEQCHQYNECTAYSAFTAASKPVFNAEYAKKYRSGAAQNQLCTEAKSQNIRTLVLPVALDGSYRYSCD